MLAFWLGLLGPIVALVGWFGFHSLPALLIGTLCYVAEVLLECRRNGFSDRGTDIVVFVFGCIAGCFIPDVPWYICGAVASNFYNIYMTLLAMVLQFFF